MSCLFLHIFFLKLETVHPAREENLLERMALLAGWVTSAVTLVTVTPGLKYRAHSRGQKYRSLFLR